jgi:hypothetical protein
MVKLTKKILNEISLDRYNKKYHKLNRKKQNEVLEIGEIYVRTLTREKARGKKR